MNDTLLARMTRHLNFVMFYQLTRFRRIAVPVVLVGELPRVLVEAAAYQVRLGPDSLPPEAFDRARRQFRAREALEILTAQSPSDHDEPRILITGADLFLCGSPFVFGASMPDRGTALVSTFRLDGRPHRLASVIRHELAHLIGLPHCSTILCAMRRADSVSDIDERGVDLCPACQRKLDAMSIGRGQ